MRDEYDFSKMEPAPNPYPKLLKKQVTMNISEEAIDYFKEESKRTGIPYQTLINFYLVDCATKKRKLNMSWE